MMITIGIKKHFWRLSELLGVSPSCEGNFPELASTHQGIRCETPIKKPKYIPLDAENIKLKSTPVLNGLYHTYSRSA